MKDARIEVTRCPKCGALCVIGSDEDYQVFCAHCKHSFKCEHETSISVETYRKYREEPGRYFESGGWEAFVVKK